MSPTRQASPGRLFMQSRRSGSCSLNIQSVMLLRWLGGGTKELLCVVLYVIDDGTTGYHKPRSSSLRLS